MRISVIIPTFNEEENIRKLIPWLEANSSPENLLEIVVVDGGSRDNTVDIAEEVGAQVHRSTKSGRAVQLALGGKKAKGEILYFLHADTFPPPRFDEIILNAVRKQNPAGCFQIQFDPSSWALRLFEAFVRFPWMICRGGDQSLYVTRELYSRIGGFNPGLKIMEDLEIIRQIRRESPFHILSQRVITSSRKYQNKGTWRLQMLYAWVHFQYWTGVPNERIFENSKKWVQKDEYE
ncbi:TIGR04283 family arsenosugar biosynthesis glycosyltransferase [bacterium SCSIO 12741]|nr:TIGR04283 family arsenosugar biosynthesis glycosyltransferase [bacterium SCSIO 12741]